MRNVHVLVFFQKSNCKQISDFVSIGSIDRIDKVKDRKFMNTALGANLVPTSVESFAGPRIQL